MGHGGPPAYASNAEINFIFLKVICMAQQNSAPTVKKQCVTGKKTVRSVEWGYIPAGLRPIVHTNLNIVKLKIFFH